MSQPEPKPNAKEPGETARDARETLAGLGREKHNLLPALQKVQLKLGYLPAEALMEIAAHLGMAPVEVYGVATFYNQFRLNPPGKHSVKVCLGTACHMKGGYIALEAWKRRLKISTRETTLDGEFDLDTVACIGCCHLAPVSVVDGKPEGQAEPTRVDGILLALGRDIGIKDKEQQ